MAASLVTDVNQWRGDGRTYEELCSGFQLRVPEFFNMAEATVTRHAGGLLADAPALICTPGTDGRETGITLSYRELDNQSNRFASMLQALGVRRGDVVVCYAEQGLHAALAHLAAYKLGAVIAPLSLLYGKDTLRHAINDSRSRLVVTTRSAWDAVPGLRDALPCLETVVVAGGAHDDEIDSDRFWDYSPLSAIARTSANDPALLLYTSGSTGLPKGILHAHRLILGYLASVSLFYELQMDEPGQVLWTPSDWSWIAGIVNVQMTGWFFGHTVVAGQGRFTPEWVFDFLASQGVTHTFLTPTALKRMAQVPNPRDRWPALRLRAIGTGGEPCPAAVLDWAASALQVPVNEFYGLTEVNHLVGNCSQLYPARPGSMGRVYPGHHLVILDDEGQPVNAGTPGQIAAQRDDPTLFLGYWNQPERTKAMFQDEWVLTGDYARADAEGYFWYEGRRDDLIKSAGYRIGPAEVEDTLVSHPSVEEAAVVGVPDAERGQAVKAYIKLAKGYLAGEPLAEELRQFVKNNLAVYKYPRLVEFVESFPLTSTGKISRKELRAKSVCAAATPSHPAR